MFPNVPTDGNTSGAAAVFRSFRLRSDIDHWPTTLYNTGTAKCRFPSRLVIPDQLVHPFRSGLGSNTHVSTMISPIKALSRIVHAVFVRHLIADEDRLVGNSVELDSAWGYVKGYTDRIWSAPPVTCKRLRNPY